MRLVFTVRPLTLGNILLLTLLAVSSLPALFAAQSLHHIHSSRPRCRHQ